MNNQIQQNKVLDIIIYLLEGIKGKKKNKSDKLEGTVEPGEKTILGSCNYLLGQVIRQYEIPEDHYFVSKKADALWKQITTEKDIKKFFYHDKIKKDTDGSVTIYEYKGSKKVPVDENGRVLEKGDCFTYNDVFTDEHIVTISDIIAALTDLPVWDYAFVKGVLDKIYICKMLKSEDRSIKRKVHRFLDYRETVAKDYKDAGIELC